MTNENKRMDRISEQGPENLWHPWEVISGFALAVFTLLIPLLVVSVVGVFRYIGKQANRLFLLRARVWSRIRGLR